MKLFIVTRPKLAGRLIAAGHECRETVNPFKQDYKAWEFTLDDDAVRIISEYYSAIGYEPPKVIKMWDWNNECV